MHLNFLFNVVEATLECTWNHPFMHYKLHIGSVKAAFISFKMYFGAFEMSLDELKISLARSNNF